MDSRTPKPDANRRSSRDEHGRRTAAKAAVLVPVTVFMPFIVLWHALRGIWADQTSRGILITAGLLLIAGTVIFMIIEGFSLIDSFYFSFITLATIGYGDFSPSTDLGKLVTVAYSFAGLGIMAALISAIARPRRAARDRDADDERRRTDPRATPGDG
jgi:hypothetical protein